MNPDLIDPYLKILFVGLDGSGKSTIISKLIDLKPNEVKEIYPTPFINCHRTKLDNKNVIFIEISGLKRFRNVWKNFYNEINGIVFVIDGTDPVRLNVVKECVLKMDRDLSSGKMMPVAFFINKQDESKCLTVDQVKNYLELDKLDTNFISHIYRGSAFNNIGLNDCLSFITAKLIQE